MLGTTLDAFAAWCAEQDLPAYRARQVYAWVFARGAADFAEMTDLPRPLRETLTERWSIRRSEVVRRREAADGTVKLLLAWPDGETSECVLIPDDDRRTACISTQVGCPVGCAFCASGLDGLRRQLSAGEIVEQVVRVRELCGEKRLTNVVVMGLGEPLANYPALVQALRIINAPWGLNIGARRITVSTVGLPAGIRKLAREGLQVNLAISLHAPDDKLRRTLIPWAEKIAIDEIVQAGREFFEITGREVTVEYVLLRGINDKVYHAHELVKVCRKMRCNVNLIRYNPVADLPFERPSSFATERFLTELRQRGVNAHLRASRGLDIDAACGQLRRSTISPPPKSPADD